MFEGYSKRQFKYPADNSRYQDTAQRFERWMDWFEQHLPERPEDFPWGKFDEEGLMLARDLKCFVGIQFEVYYDEKKVDAGPTIGTSPSSDAV